MATLASLTLDVEDMLYGNARIERPTEDTIAVATADAADVAWQMTNYAMWHRGDYAEYVTPPATADDGTQREIVLMTTDHPAAGDVTVRRSQRRTTAAVGVIAIGAVFRKNPMFDRARIVRFITEVIDNDLWPDLWIRSKRTLTWLNDVRYYELAALDFDVEEVYQYNLTGQEIGNCTVFTQASETWTLPAHGLVAGDHVRFTTAGTVPAEYLVDTDYWVISAATANTFILSATKGGAAKDGTGAVMAGTWTVERRVPDLHPLHIGNWGVVTDTASNLSSTGRLLRLWSVYNVDEPVYYTARTKPSAAVMTTIPDAMARIIPWGVCGKLLAGTRMVAQRVDPLRNRQMTENAPHTAPRTDAQYFMGMFEAEKQRYRRMLLTEKTPQQKFKGRFVRRG